MLELAKRLIRIVGFVLRGDGKGFLESEFVNLKVMSMQNISLASRWECSAATCKQTQLCLLEWKILIWKSWDPFSLSFLPDESESSTVQQTLQMQYLTKNLVLSSHLMQSVNEDRMFFSACKVRIISRCSFNGWEQKANKLLLTAPFKRVLSMFHLCLKQTRGIYHHGNFSRIILLSVFLCDSKILISTSRKLFASSFLPRWQCSNDRGCEVYFMVEALVIYQTII